ncbi:MAG: ferredoxin family protein [Candidatus Caldatribacteriota bacterium]|nr:ferredoxin family protein [Candidatus Caldatribacteriota bacterium]
MKEKLTKTYQNDSVRISIHEGWCKACGICIEFCPKDVLVPNDQGIPVPKNIDDCTKCQLCELRCPDFAITVEGMEERDE